MNYNKVILFISCMLGVTPVSAQTTQHGVVKTRGRMVNGVLQPGKGLADATVTIQGRNAVASQAGGNFSFPVPSKNFRIQSVVKNGYKLVDADVTAKSYNYSAEPFFLVMETPEQQQSDQLAKERRLRRDLQHRLREKEDEIENLNISLEEKNRMLQEINKEREDNEKIITDLARYYSTIDYDQLDDFQRTVSNLLEEGQLEKADSMLRTRGNMVDRVMTLQMEQKAEEEEAEELAMRQERLDISRKGTLKKIEAAAEDCYSFYQRFLQVHQNDSAAWYLELRAKLDSTNIEWLDDMAWFADNYLANYSKALDYYEKAFRIASTSEKKDSDDIASYNYKIGGVYMSALKYDMALKYVQEALKINLELYDEEDADVAKCYDRIGLIYDKKGNWEEAIKNLNKAFEIRLEICDSDDMDLAKSINNIAVVCSNFGETDSTYLDLLTTAINIALENYDDDDINLAPYYNNIAFAYSDLGKNDLALEYYQKVLALYQKEFGETHPEVAQTYFNIGSVYIEQEKYKEGIELLQEALRVYNSVYGEHHVKTADCYALLGLSYYHKDELEKAMDYYLKALKIGLDTYGEQNLDIASYYRVIGHVHYRKQNYRQALDNYFKSMNIIESILGGKNEKEANVCTDIAGTYQELGLSKEAISYYQKVVDIYRQDNNNKEKLIELYNNIGNICYDEDEYEHALENYRSKLQLQVDSTGEQHADAAYTYRQLGNVCYRQDNYEQAVTYYLKSFDIRKAVLPFGDVKTAIVCKDIADTYWELDNHLKAIEYYQETIRLYQLVEEPDDDDRTEMSTSKRRLMYECISAGQEYEAQKDYILAIRYYKQALDTIMVIGDKDNMVTCSTGLGNAYCGVGDYDTAMQHYETARKYLQWVDDFSDKEEFSTTLANSIMLCRYEKNLSAINPEDDFLNEIIIKAFFKKGDTPAQRQGLDGDYAILSLTGWNVADRGSFFKNLDSQAGKPIDIIVMRDGVFSKHHFDDKIGVTFYVKQVGKDERIRTLRAFENWKLQNTSK